MKRWLVLLLAGAIARAGETGARIDALAAPYIDNDLVVGMTVAVLQRDGGTYVAGYGKTGIGDARPDGGTVYEIGSISKVFTGVLLAGMVADKQVRLDQPVKKLVPRTVTVPKRGARAITLLDLATHSSGLPRMPGNFAPKDPANPYFDYTEERMFAFLSGHALRRAPGVQYEYSNYGMGLLGHLLARRAGKPYAALLDERICKPLGLADTTITVGAARTARLAFGHDANGSPMVNWHFHIFAGAGGIRSTATDMLRFLRANLETADTPVSRALANARTVRFRPRSGPALGLGWHVGPSGIHFHTGQTGGYHSYVAVDTRNRVAVVVLANTATAEVDQFGESVLRLLLGAAEKPRVMPREVAVDAETLAAYAGTYALSPAFKLHVTLEKGQLMVRATGQQKLPVYAESETRFFWRVVDAQMTFERDKDGRVVAAVLHQNGIDQRAARQ